MNHSTSVKTYKLETIPLTERHKSVQSPLVYIWESSIPDRLQKNLKFRHISQTAKSKNTLEFLVETQKYISKICDRSTEKIKNNFLYYPLLKSTPEKQKSITRIHRKVRNNIFNTINQNYDDPKGLVLADLPKFERTKGGKTQISVSPILRKSCSEKKVLPMLDIKPLLRNQDKTAISSISNSIYFSPKDLNLKANLISNEFQENQILMTRSGKRVNTERAVKSSLGFRGMKRNSTISS